MNYYNIILSNVFLKVLDKFKTPERLAKTLLAARLSALELAK